jgi:GT2 family glycosyltransferase
VNPPAPPLISVVILNYNGAPWLERCLQSLRIQSLFDHIEVIVADNSSPDGSGAIAESLLKDWPNGRYLQHGANLGYCEGNNRAAQIAHGEFLFFLNNDTWLEPHCLQRLLEGTRVSHASAATPLVLNYHDNTLQTRGAAGFDLFGLPTSRSHSPASLQILMPEGCSYLIQRHLFIQLQGFDSSFFMFSDELDLSWRVWIAGHKAVIVPDALLHHRGAANVNPAGGDAVAELRTSDTKRFYANRNNLLVLLKNCQNLLLLLVPLQLLLLFLEAIIGLCLVRRWSFIRRAYVDAVLDCYRLRNHIRTQRRRIRQFRRRNDLWMLRFLRLRLNRWDELQRIRRFGFPKVTPK